ncbi:MAG: hypothetical protein V3T08_09950 [Gemmatimonadota bacterium]
MTWVELNIAAFLAATQRKYEPEEVAAILHYDPQVATDAMYALGVTDRRHYDRRSVESQFTIPLQRREKDRRADGQPPR